MKTPVIVLSIVLLFAYSCQSNAKNGVKGENKQIELPDWEKPEKIAYEVKNTKEWLKDSTLGSSAIALAVAVNRTDLSHFKQMDSVIVPVDLSGDIVYYFPFPLTVPYLEDVDKIVFFSYPTQTFAAYEKGVLVRTGPTNMGREKDPTPTGLFNTNWKAKKTTSTVNDEWILKWNFNIANKAGIGWHQYSMPGYPASHSCLRLQESDAKYLFNWADKWILENKTTVTVKGTPVIVFGSYDFHAPKPWFKLVNDPHALDISVDEVKKIAEPYKKQILADQEKRREYSVE